MFIFMNTVCVFFLMFTGDNSSLSIYEKALYGYLCGSANSMLPACTSWKNFIWANCIELRVREKNDSVREMVVLGVGACIRDRSIFWSFGLLLFRCFVSDSLAVTVCSRSTEKSRLQKMTES